jgi:hypothetical protein
MMKLLNEFTDFFENRAAAATDDSAVISTQIRTHMNYVIMARFSADLAGRSDRWQPDLTANRRF